MSPARSSRKPAGRATNRSSGRAAPRSGSKDAGRGGAKSRSGAPGSIAKPRSAAAEKAIAARAADHAAKSVRNADRPGAAKRAATARANSRAAAPRRQNAPRGLGGEQIEGRQAVRELLLAGTRRVREVWVASDMDDAVVLDDIAELAMSVGVPVRDVTKAKLLAEARTEAPQGVLAKAAELREAELEDLVAPRGGGKPFLLLVDGVTDPGNLGNRVPARAGNLLLRIVSAAVLAPLAIAAAYFGGWPFTLAVKL